ncbi:MAG TPA: HdeA/HdeB family chaperone [Xanthobacteraceae bacterium]|nr:HdeA/HdeB family chaperone [Xanthobacteraceae bacterium]
MKLLASAAVALTLAVHPAAAQKLDLSDVTCTDFLQSGEDNIAFILMWLHGFYKSAEGQAIIDFGEMRRQAERLGDYCRTHPSATLVKARDEVME